MWGTQIDWAPFPSVVKFICAHPTQSARTRTFLLSHNHPQMWLKLTHKHQTVCDTSHLVPIQVVWISTAMLTGKEEVTTTNTVCGVYTALTSCAAASISPWAGFRGVIKAFKARVYGESSWKYSKEMVCWQYPRPYLYNLLSIAHYFSQKDAAVVKDGAGTRGQC